MQKVFWIIAIGITCLNAFFLYSRAQKEIALHPELAHGYNLLVKGYLVLLNLPWLVMGLGIVVGGTQSVFQYFEPRSANPYVVAFHITAILLSMLVAGWIYFADGAEFLVRYPGVINIETRSPLIIKLLFGLGLLGTLAAEVVMWSGRFPVNRP